MEWVVTEIEEKRISGSNSNLIQNKEDIGQESLSSIKSLSLTTSNDLGKKTFKTGVVYLSFIPPYMSPDVLRRMLSKYAAIGRIFIQVTQEPGGRKKKICKDEVIYEGWVEFLKKRHAKQLASMLNNTKMGGKKKSRFYDCLWNIKYLPRFKWAHLMERLNYERAMMKQKLRAEISQAKRVANHFKDAVDKHEFDKKINRKNDQKIGPAVKELTQLSQRFKQKISNEDKGKTLTEQKRENFLKSLFS